MENRAGPLSFKVGEKDENAQNATWIWIDAH
jgi:hypothetical protein